MFAVVVEVNADESHIEQAREGLPREVVPVAQQAGARAGYWMAPTGGRGGLAVVVFDSEDTARAMASQMKVGDPAGAVEDVTIRSVEVREVLAHL